MPMDRVLRFSSPTDRAAIEAVARDYLGDTGRVTDHYPGTDPAVHDGRFFLVLPGTYRDSDPRPGDEELAGVPRVVEVFVGVDFVNVMTRSADRLTRAVAHGLAQAIAAHWRVPYVDDPMRQLLLTLPSCGLCRSPATYAHVHARQSLRCDVHVPRPSTGWAQLAYAHWIRSYNLCLEPPR